MYQISHKIIFLLKQNNTFVKKLDLWNSSKHPIPLSNFFVVYQCKKETNQETKSALKNEIQYAKGFEI
jgi:hypothetical protein